MLCELENSHMLKIQYRSIFKKIPAKKARSRFLGGKIF